MGNLKGQNVLNGTFVEIWLDDEVVAEATALQAKVEFQTEDLKFAGDLFQHRKVVGYKGSGSLSMHKVSTRFQKAVSDTMKTGKERYYTLIYKLDDPAVDGQERVVLKDVAFDDLTIIDLEVGTTMKLEVPFSFSDYDFLDSIQ